MKEASAMPCTDWPSLRSSLNQSLWQGLWLPYVQYGLCIELGVMSSLLSWNRCWNKCPLQPLCYTVSEYDYRKLPLRDRSAVILFTNQTSLSHLISTGKSQKPQSSSSVTLGVMWEGAVRNSKTESAHKPCSVNRQGHRRTFREP